MILLVYLGLQGGFLSGLLGVGGGAIAIAVLAVTGTSQVLAQGIAMMATIPTVIVGALPHRRQGTLALAARRSRSGSWAWRSRSRARCSPSRSRSSVLRTGFGVFLLIGSYRMFRALRRVPVAEPPP